MAKKCIKGGERRRAQLKYWENNFNLKESTAAKKCPKNSHHFPTDRGFLAASTQDPSSSWKIELMGFFAKQKVHSTPGPGPSEQGPPPTSPEEYVGCEIVYEGESPIKAE